MKKVYLLLTAICLAALTGCIKEEYTLEETAITVNVSTRATGTQSTEQGDGINDVNVWAFKYTVDEDNTWNVTDTATAWSRVPAMAAWSSVDVHLQFMACTTTEKYILVAVINQRQFGTIKVGNETITLGRNTTYSQLKNAKFVAPNELMGSNPGNGSGADPDYMPISHWKTFELTAAHAGNTHPNTCLVVPMPVYRALAKTQLLVAKSDANSTVTIKNVTLGAGPIMGTDGKIISTNAYPTEGALLSAAAGTYDEDKNTAGDFAAPGDTTPLWYVSSVSTTSHNNTVDATDNEVDIFDPSTTNTGAVSAVLTEDDHGSDDVDFDDYQYITSYFLYENAGGNGGAWNKPSTNGGYYMDVTYDLTPDKDNDDKTERVWLPAVVRNHDIQVRALVNAGGKLELTFNVQPWTDISTSWNYTDVVTINENGHLSWITGSYEKIETDTETNVSTVTMKKVTSGSTTSYTNLQCTFHIDTPEDATWYASFISGDINSFEFVSANSGPVGERATLTIKAKNSTISTSQMAYLDIVIVTADGRTLKSSELTNGLKYQLVQNP